MIRLAAASAAVGLILAGCAPSGMPGSEAPKAAAACFQASSVASFSDAGPNTLRVRLGASEIWEMTVAPGCPDLDFAQAMTLTARGGDQICSGRDAELRVASPGGGWTRCLVRDVRPRLASGG